jgi:ferritin-like metal-binding protein YciE
MPFGDDNGQGTKKLNELFQEEKKTDVTLTKVAKTVVNQQAAA